MRPERIYYVYILASGPNGTLYIGMTNDLGRRVFEHREGLVEGFTKTYNVKTLVYFEGFPHRPRGHTSRKANEEISSRLEDKSHLGAQSGLAGSSRDSQ
jgi:predicted GIY-YIG superfamily endonuclease